MLWSYARSDSVMSLGSDVEDIFDDAEVSPVGGGSTESENTRGSVSARRCANPRRSAARYMRRYNRRLYSIDDGEDRVSKGLPDARGVGSSRKDVLNENSEGFFGKVAKLLRLPFTGHQTLESAWSGGVAFCRESQEASIQEVEAPEEEFAAARLRSIMKAATSREAPKKSVRFADERPRYRQPGLGHGKSVCDGDFMPSGYGLEEIGEFDADETLEAFRERLALYGAAAGSEAYFRRQQSSQEYDYFGGDDIYLPHISSEDVSYVGRPCRANGPVDPAFTRGCNVDEWVSVWAQ